MIIELYVCICAPMSVYVCVCMYAYLFKSVYGYYWVVLDLPLEDMALYSPYLHVKDDVVVLGNCWQNAMSDTGNSRHNVASAAVDIDACVRQPRQQQLWPQT